MNVTDDGLGAESQPPEAKGGVGAKLPAAGGRGFGDRASNYRGFLLFFEVARLLLFCEEIN